MIRVRLNGSRRQLKAKREKGELDLKAKLDESKGKIEKLKQEGEAKLAKVEGDADKKLQGDYDKELASIDKRVEAARKKDCQSNQEHKGRTWRSLKTLAGWAALAVLVGSALYDMAERLVTGIGRR